MAINRELTFENYLAILRRRRWMIIIPAILCAVGGYLLSLALPARYTSHTLVLVEQPAVPDSYVKPVVSQDLSQQLASMKEQILSRTRLQGLVEQFSLYGKDANGLAIEVFVERLRKSIEVTPLSPMQGTRSADLPGFTVDVTLGDARLAQQVCSKVTSMFMEQNLRFRQQQAEDTTQFLAKQLEDAKGKLDEQDAKLAELQRRHIGALPDDEKTNLTLLMGMTPQLDAATQAVNQARQEKAFTESMLSQQLAALKSPLESQDPETLEQQVSKLQKQLLELQGRYTAEHPDVAKIKNEIAELQKRMQDSSAQKQKLSNEQKRPSIYEPPQIQQLRAQLRQLELSISQRTHEQQQLQQQIRKLQERIQSSPLIQQEFKALTRDHQTALSFYNDLLKKRNESQMASELERRQEGGQFRVLDPPSLPERPSFPKRRLFGLGGLGAGLLLGVGLVQLTEWRDKSLRTKRDIEIYLGVPILAQIPAIAPFRDRTNGGNNLRATMRNVLSFRASA